MLTKMARGTETLKIFHTHDCEECVFLGHALGLDGAQNDVWLHNGEHQTDLLIRFGQEGDYMSYDLSHAWEDQLPDPHPYHKATKLFREYMTDPKWITLDVIPQDVRDSDDLEESEFKKVVGLYEDIQYAVKGDKWLITDSHNAELMVGKWTEEDSGWYEMHIIAEWVAASDSIMKFRSRRAMFLYAMYLQQLGDDYGY